MTAPIREPGAFDNEHKDQVPAHMHSFTSQNIANILWSYGKLGLKSSPLFSLMKSVVIERVTGFNTQELANVVWAYATNAEQTPELFSAVAGAFSAKIREANALNLTTMAWAFAKAEVSCPDLYHAIAHELLARDRKGRKLDTCSPQNLANLLWAFAKQRHYLPELLLSVRRPIIEQASRMNSQEVSNTAWALATLGVQDSELFTTLGNEFLSRANQFTPQGISNVAWSLASQDDCIAATAVLRTALLLAEERSWDLKGEELRALFQTCLALREQVPPTVIPLLATLEPPRPQATPCQSQLADILSRAGIPYRAHAPVAGYVIDFTIDAPQDRLAVSCGYYRHSGDTPRPGSDIIRRKVLENLGFSVVEVTPRDMHYFIERIRLMFARRCSLTDLPPL